MRLGRHLDVLKQDLRYATRMLAAHRGLSLVAVLSLALGIGANTAIFSLVDAVILRNLPVKEPERIVLLSDPSSGGVSIGIQTGERSLFTYTEFERLRAGNNVFSGMFASESGARHVSARIDRGPAERAVARLVTGGYFRLLGVDALLGRTFSEEDERGPGSDPYAVISYSYWRKRFGQDASALGRSVEIGKAQLTIIGVLPPGFFGETVGESPDLYVPMMMEPLVKPGRDWLRDDPNKAEKVMWLHLVGRLKPGANPHQAQANLNVVFQRYLKSLSGAQLPADRQKELLDQKIVVHAGAKGASELRTQASEPLFVLMAVVGLVLLIACANVANLLLARAASRRKETAVRLALGAGRFALIRQALTESILLSLVGGALGFLFARWGVDILLRLVSEDADPIPLAATLDLRVLAFTAALSILTGLLFGLLPALRTSRFDINHALREQSRGLTGSSRRVNAGRILVVAQVAMSLLLLIGAGLFVRTLRNLQNVDLGYSRDRLVIARVDAVEAGYKGAGITELYRRLAERFRAIPGVRAVTLSENGLFSGTESGDRISVEGYTPNKPGDDSARFDLVGPNYFSSVGIPMLLGREIGTQDHETAPRVCVINETMARFYFGDRNPIGRHVTDEFPDTRITFQIVGVSKDARDHTVRGEVRRRFYIPVYQGFGGAPPSVYFELRTFTEPRAIFNEVQRGVREIDPRVPVLRLHTLEELLNRGLNTERLIAQLSAFFGALALLLASIGLYGVLSYAVARRTNEIGVRMALGANRATVLGMVLRETLAMVAVGAAVGIPAAMASSRIVSNRLFGVQSADPVTLVAATLILGSVAALAGYLPARRAAKVDPLTALRYE